MWVCHLCERSFEKQHQHHYCGDQTVGDFLKGKTDFSLRLFDHLVLKFEEIGPIKLHSTKSMIVIAADTGFAYIIQLGKNFIDIVLPFTEIHEDNFCFRKIAMVPSSKDYNHHLRIMSGEDLNEEVLGYMKKAYINGKKV